MFTCFTLVLVLPHVEGMSWSSLVFIFISVNYNGFSHLVLVFNLVLVNGNKLTTIHGDVNNYNMSLDCGRNPEHLQKSFT